MKKIFFVVLIFCSGVLTITSCGPEGGIGGDSSIVFTAKHHDDLIPFCKVFIKYDTQSFPGVDTTAYDDMITTDNSAAGSFTDLKKGNYYLYGVGYDSAIAEPMYGGIPVSIKKSGEVVTTSVPVTE